MSRRLPPDGTDGTLSRQRGAGTFAPGAGPETLDGSCGAVPGGVKPGPTIGCPAPANRQRSGAHDHPPRSRVERQVSKASIDGCWHCARRANSLSLVSRLRFARTSPRTASAWRSPSTMARSISRISSSTAFAAALRRIPLSRTPRHPVPPLCWTPEGWLNYCPEKSGALYPQRSAPAAAAVVEPGADPPPEGRDSGTAPGFRRAACDTIIRLRRILRTGRPMTVAAPSRTPADSKRR